MLIMKGGIKVINIRDATVLGLKLSRTLIH